MQHDTDGSPLVTHLRAEHRTLAPHVGSMLVAARAVGVVPMPVLRGMTEDVLHFVLRELAPHAELEERVLYPAVEQALRAPGATVALRREHAEVDRLARDLSELVGSLASGRGIPEDLAHELRRVLYGLHAIVSLHFAQEDDLVAGPVVARLSAADQNLVLTDLLAHARD